MHTSRGHNFWTEWELYEKVEFDGQNKLIIVHDAVTDLSIREDVYSAWVRWHDMDARGYDRWELAMEYSGLDDIPGGQTGVIFFMRNQWRLVVDLTKVKINGVLYSRNFDTAYYDKDLNPVYPATVASIVSQQNIIVESSAPTAEEIWSYVDRILTDPRLVNLDAPITSRSSHTANDVWQDPDACSGGGEVPIAGMCVDFTDVDVVLSDDTLNVRVGVDIMAVLDDSDEKYALLDAPIVTIESNGYEVSVCQA